MKIAVGIVIFGNNLVFIRRKKEPFKGVLILPGGKIKDKETPENALIRKIHEETGLTVTQNELVGEFYESLIENGKVYGHEISIFLCSATGVVKSSGEIELIEVNELGSRKDDIVPSDYKMIEKALLNGERGFTHEVSVKKVDNAYTIFSEAVL